MMFAAIVQSISTFGSSRSSMQSILRHAMAPPSICPAWRFKLPARRRPQSPEKTRASKSIPPEPPGMMFSRSRNNKGQRRACCLSLMRRGRRAWLFLQARARAPASAGHVKPQYQGARWDGALYVLSTLSEPNRGLFFFSFFSSFFSFGPREDDLLHGAARGRAGCWATANRPSGS